MNFDQMKKEYNARYNVEAYANDEETKTMLGMFDKAEALSPKAKAEFVKAFNYEFALDGEMYLGGKKTAAYNYPNLIAEAPSAGITVTTR